MVLVDTSAWIEFFRRGGQEDVANCVAGLLASDAAATCGMIELELLQGLFAHEAGRVRGLLQALHYIDLERADYLEAGDRLRALRTQGTTVPASDGLIATAAMRRELGLLSTDRHFLHFPGLKRVSP